MPFVINGAAASIAPIEQAWFDVPLGQNLAGRTIYYDKKRVVLTFDSCPMNLYKQWEDAVTGGSVGTMTLLSQDNITFTAFSGVFMDFDKRPAIRAGIAQGPWSIEIREVASA